jgi:hypothetical protein
MAVNGSKAPSCPISRNQAVSGMPARKMPPIPRALDLPSAIAALNDIALLLQPGVNSGQSTGSSQGDSFSQPSNNNPNIDDGSGSKKKKRWDELNRGTHQAYVSNPVNKDITIEYPRINYLEFEEIRTITYLDWHLGEDSVS